MWEKRYGIIQPHRTKTNIRYYSDHHLQKLMNICLLNQNGLKISHIADMTEDALFTEVAALSEQADYVNVDINIMVMAALDLHEEQFDRVLNNCLLKAGFEKTFCNVIFPLLEKLSVMWQIGRINACQERFIFNLIRQKLIVATDGLSGAIDEGNEHFLLFTPAEHDHEIGLLFTNYLLRKNKYQVVYLGASVPFDHLRRLQNPERFHQILVSLNYQWTEEDLQKYLLNLRSIFPNQPIHFVPIDLENSTDEFPDVYFYSHYQDFSQKIST